MHRYFHTLTELPSHLIIGNPVIDGEHSALMRHLERLRDVQNELTNSEVVGEAIHGIGRILLEHFDHEEVIMKGTSMPEHEIQRHLTAHNDIVLQWSNLQSMMMKSGPVVAGELLAMAEEWITLHIQDYDLAIRAYI